MYSVGGRLQSYFLILGLVVLYGNQRGAWAVLAADFIQQLVLLSFSKMNRAIADSRRDPRHAPDQSQRGAAAEREIPNGFLTNS
jgi:hypothetical protein